MVLPVASGVLMQRVSVEVLAGIAVVIIVNGWLLRLCGVGHGAACCLRSADQMHKVGMEVLAVIAVIPIAALE
ncbi:hypothetical protein Aduo_008056 [Ancylostoma duodenale]